MAQLEVFDHIINLPIDPVTIDIDGKTYPLNMESLLLTVAANIILVLEGGRLSYRLDPDAACILQTVLSCAKVLISDNNPPESLIFLKKNASSIVNMKKLHKDINIFYGKVLGYGYTGKDWVNGYRDCYMIAYQIKHNNETPAFLYTFNCPVKEYNENIRCDTLEKLATFQRILNPYNVTVNVHCSLYPAHGIPSVIELP